MTVAQMHTSFKFGMDKLDSLNMPNFLTEEIDLLLNQAQERVVKQRYSTPAIFFNKDRSFDESQKRMEDLKNIVVTTTIPPNAYSSSNIDLQARFYTLPTNHWFIVQERVWISFLDPSCNKTVSKQVQVVPITHNEFDNLIRDPFNKPNDEKILRLMSNSMSELISISGVSLGDYTVRYIKEPVSIDFTTGVDCELSSQLHQEIVNEAIALALEGIESPRQNTFNVIKSTQE
jgi:hypothetical protein